ncbi:unnamed protein product [Darwinula stevensoni]|uniref:C1q domain-containing protein n=1 Tax=Darwinula stevensoni TaxID=69355 RepID=A0A7R8XAJ0_9CRUS|nr:unnamed protein product [Darwinula stevensoni]CAG0885541.1 unnamed protein product [Darwinula stevensoni]
MKMKGISSLLVVALIASTECTSGNKIALNSVPEPNSVADLEKMISIMMAKIEELAKNNAQLKLNVAQLERNDEHLKSLLENKMEDRLQYLEAVTRQITPPTCETLASLGVTRTGSYLVDPDGVLRGDPPIRVLCDMKTDPVSTIVLHDSMGNTEVKHCPKPGCYRRRVAYDASVKQMNALIERSESCKQEIRYDCYSTALTVSGTNYAWWVDRHGEPQYYWAGSHAGKHVCSCGLTDNCVDPTVPCNCDAEASQWESDVGAITNRTALPIKELRFGNLRFKSQEANYTLGGLVCMGKAPSPNNPAESCSSLRKAGHTRTGYYLISTKKGRLDVVLCQMDLEDADSSFQLDTGARIAEKSVSFNVYRTSDLTSPGRIPFERTEVNIGNAMDPNSGIFTATLDGIYAFHFHFLSSLVNRDTMVQIRQNGATKGMMYASIDSVWHNSGNSFLFSLKSGDQVDVHLDRGGLHSIFARFVGYLLYPM